MAPNFGDYVDHANKRSDIYTAARDVDYLLMAIPEFWKHGGDEKFFSSTDAVIGVVSATSFKEAYRVGMDTINYHWKEMRNTYVQPEKERYARPLTYNELAGDIKPVIFVAPPPQKSNSSSPEQQLRYILASFYEEIWPLFAPDWRPWRDIFPTLSTGDMLNILDHVTRLEQKNELVNIKQRVVIIVGLETAYCKETHDDVKQFLDFLEMRFLYNESGKILLFCETPFNARGILGLNIHRKSSVVEYEGSIRSPSDTEIRESISDLEWTRDSGEEDLTPYSRYQF
ncbi:hypothetical protein GGR53DRAFT_165045 [Hypoxylon sp. FL1150]|nr:hypothetical protein GGR53DRAFT_165045 [Hypoxylon sp. FL1150]